MVEEALEGEKEEEIKKVKNVSLSRAQNQCNTHNVPTQQKVSK